MKELADIEANLYKVKSDIDDLQSIELPLFYYNDYGKEVTEFVSREEFFRKLSHIDNSVIRGYNLKAYSEIIEKSVFPNLETSMDKIFILITQLQFIISQQFRRERESISGPPNKIGRDDTNGRNDTNDNKGTK